MSDDDVAAPTDDNAACANEHDAQRAAADHHPGSAAFEQSFADARPASARPARAGPARAAPARAGTAGAD